jgi:hypothetical protein
MPGNKWIADDVRFWSNVDIRTPEECWNWTASVNSTGRGAFSIDGKNIKAHRMAWILTYGEIPEGMIICHKCDNGKCCNPNHLFLGTHRDNTQDMISKGRRVILNGEDDPKHKLTEHQVLEIRRLYKPWRYSQFRLAYEFGVSRSTIEEILHRRIWKHI